MAKTIINSGICGFVTTVTAQMVDDECTLHIESDCPSIRKMAEELKQVDPFKEMAFRGAGPLTYQIAVKHCKHAGCPVPAGIVKAVEVAAGLALPADATIKVMANE